MNEQIQEFARDQLIKGLTKCTEEHRLLFKRMYSHKDLDKPIHHVVRDMPEDKLDWAMQQVQLTLKESK